MTTRTYGIHYEATKNLTSKEIAAHMRRVVRQAAKDGLLPAEYAYSVKLSRSSMSTAINIYVIVPDAVEELRREWCDGTRPNYTHADAGWFNMAGEKFTPLQTLAATERALHEIHNAYNYDGSDSMTDYFDVRFYGFVNVIGATHWEKFYK